MEKPKSSGQTNPVKAIRAYCLNCCLESSNEVAACTAEGCELYAFRFGKNPYRTKRVLTEEQKQARAEQLRRFKLEKSRLQIETKDAE